MKIEIKLKLNGKWTEVPVENLQQAGVQSFMLDSVVPVIMAIFAEDIDGNDQRVLLVSNEFKIVQKFKSEGKAACMDTEWAAISTSGILPGIVLEVFKDTTLIECRYSPERAKAAQEKLSEIQQELAI